MHHPSLKNHPSPLGHGLEASQWSLSCCLLHTSTLPTQLPEPELSEDGEEDKDNDDEEDNYVTQRYDDSSESSDTDSIDSTSDAEC